MFALLMFFRHRVSPAAPADDHDFQFPIHPMPPRSRTSLTKCSLYILPLYAHPQKIGVGSLFCKNYPFFFALLRSASVRNCLRRRTFLGVISRYSSPVMTSRPRSMVSVSGGVRSMDSSEPDARILLNCFPLVGLTDISSPFAVLPITMPSYTSVPAGIYSVPRSCRFHSEQPAALPGDMEIMEPTLRFLISPAHGKKPETCEDIMPSPRVSIMNWLRYPKSPRVGPLNVRRTKSPETRTSSTTNPRAPRRSIIAP